jgi:hypothetical protein
MQITGKDRAAFIYSGFVAPLTKLANTEDPAAELEAYAKNLETIDLSESKLEFSQFPFYVPAASDEELEAVREIAGMMRSTAGMIRSAEQ